MTMSLGIRSTTDSRAAAPGSSEAPALRTRHAPLLPWRQDASGEEWRRWQEHLKKRRLPRPLVELAPYGATPPLLWAAPKLDDSELWSILKAAAAMQNGQPPSGELLHGLGRFNGEAPMFSNSESGAVPFALARLAASHSLPRLAGALDETTWSNLLGDLLRDMEESAALTFEENPLGRLLLGGELPWTLAYLFPELAPCRQLADRASEVLSRGLLDLLDGEGVLASRWLPLLRPLLALWTRCGLMARAMNEDCFSHEAHEQYAWLVERAVLLSRPDGDQLLTPGAEGSWRTELFEAALSLADDPHDERLARAVLPLPPKKRLPVARGAAPPPAFQSEWAETALLRTENESDSPRLLVTYGRRNLLAELTNRDSVVFSGSWSPEIQVNGEPLTSAGNWEEVCWVSDADLDYLELEMTLTGGWRVQRQMALARKDCFLYVADAVLGAEAGHIEYRCTIPLAARVEFAGEDQTRDGALSGRKKLATVLPLALPEWRSDRRPSYLKSGSLQAAGAGLELSLAAQGKALYAPLFMDLAKRRLTKERTWRRLTVAERLAIQPPDVAVGYRVQVGAEQWLFYRSLAKAANRTVLGQNLASEFLAARFTPQGLAEELVSISSE